MPKAPLKIGHRREVEMIKRAMFVPGAHQQHQRKWTLVSVSPIEVGLRLPIAAATPTVAIHLSRFLRFS